MWRRNPSEYKRFKLILLLTRFRPAQAAAFGNSKTKGNKKKAAKVGQVIEL
jgi:hypothetical protein